MQPPRNPWESQGPVPPGPLLSQAQINTYLPGAASKADLGGSMCTWQKPVGGGESAGEVYVYIDTFDGSTVEDAKEQYDVRRRQDDKPGTTITAQAVGDEVRFVSYPVSNAPQAGAAAQALTGAIAQRLGRSS